MTWLLLLALAQPADQTDVVRAAKAAAMAAGVNVDADECARFEVTRRAAAMLAGLGAGLNAKPSGNNCQGYSVDVLHFRSACIDILGSGGEGPNTPHWIVLPVCDPASWRPPLDASPPGPAPRPAEPPATQEDHDAILHRLDAQLEALRADVAKLRDLEAADTEAVQQHIDQVVKNAEKSAAPLILKILSLGLVK